MHRPSSVRVSLAWLAAALPLACASAARPAPPRDLLDFEIDPPRIDGWFIRTLHFYSMPSTPTCVTVSVTPHAGSALASDSTGNLMSEFRHGRDVDTVLVRFRLSR